MGASITLAGESLIAKKQSLSEVLQVTKFVLANVPNLDTAAPVDRAAGLPPAQQIVHTVDITQSGYLTPNQVVYSLMLDSNVGDFEFNWIGLQTAEESLLIVAYVPRQQKRREIPPQQFGNNLTRNIVLEYNGAQALTGITVPASTWQFDFSTKFTQIASDLDAIRDALVLKLDKTDYKSPQSICLDGPVLIYPGTSNTYKITDYHRFSTYKPKTNVGTVTISADTITLTIPADAAAGLVSLEVERDDAKVIQKIPLGSASIQAPTFTYPAAGATGVTFEPILSISAFTVYPAGYDTHVKTRWQLSRNAGFTDLVFDINSTTQLLSFSLADGGYHLDPSKQYFGRAMALGSTLSSGWGTVTFNTAAVYIRRPAITAPTDGQLKVSSRVTLTSDVFSVSGGSDTQDASRWQLSILADFSTVAIDSGWNTSQLLNYSPDMPLANSMQYYARMKKRGVALGETDWSPVIRFTTSDELKGLFTRLNGGSTRRYAHTANAIAGKLYVFGGKYYQSPNTYYLSDLWCYDPATNAWAQMANGPGGRHSHSAAVLNGKLYIHGGSTSGSTYLDDLWSYDPATGAWTLLAKSPFTVRDNSLVAIGGKLYAYGGYSGGGYASILYSYDPSTNKWTSLTPSPNKRAEHTAVVMNGCMYVFGGNAGAGYWNDVSFYDPSADKWTQLGVGPLSQRCHHIAVAIGLKMYVFGGERAAANNPDRYLNDLWVYDLTANSWTQLGTGATTREQSAGAVINDELYFFGGTMILGGSELSDLWRVS